MGKWDVVDGLGNFSNMLCFSGYSGFNNLSDFGLPAKTPRDKRFAIISLPMSAVIKLVSLKHALSNKQDCSVLNVFQLKRF